MIVESILCEDKYSDAEKRADIKTKIKSFLNTIFFSGESDSVNHSVMVIPGDFTSVESFDVFIKFYCSSDEKQKIIKDIDLLKLEIRVSLTFILNYDQQ